MILTQTIDGVNLTVLLNTNSLTNIRLEYKKISPGREASEGYPPHTRLYRPVRGVSMTEQYLSYLPNFSAKRMSIIAAWARVVLPFGSSVVSVTPVIMPSATVQLMASTA